jgi:hypothetical protein
LAELDEIEKYIIGCPFWDTILAQYSTIDGNGEIDWNSDDDLEAFYSQYFPDDIPSEWSQKDKSASHGYGVINPNSSVSYWKYYRIYYTSKCRLVWNVYNKVDSILKNIIACRFDDVLPDIELPGTELKLDETLLKPVRRCYTVL